MIDEIASILVWLLVVISKLHIPADHEHQFRFNVNTISGPM